MFDRIVPQLWILLPLNVSQHLAKVFGLTKNGIAEIRDTTVISDGYTTEDLAGITAEKMELYVGSKEAFPRLWELTVAKARSELNPPVGTIHLSPVPQEQEDLVDKSVKAHEKRPRTKK